MSEVVWCAKLWASLWESAGKLGNRAMVSEQLLSPDWKEWEEWPAVVNEWPLPPEWIEWPAGPRELV